MSRQHAAHAGHTAGLAEPARAGDAATAAAPPFNAHAHAHFGHSFTQIAAFPGQQDGPPDVREAAPPDVSAKTPDVSAERPDVREAGGTGGSPLPPQVRRRMEAAFAHPFDDVRVHSGPEARTVGALAYTRGADVHFQPGLYDPQSPGGRELLGHELTHVVQQRAGRVASPGGRTGGRAPINADPALEAEADALGRRAARGEPARVSGAGAGLQRKADGPGAPIQRDEDDEFKALDMSAALKPNEFLPNRSVTAPVNNSPERSRIRPNATNAQRGYDAPKVTAFRSRMAGEMAAQQTLLADNDALPADINATRPTVKNPEGFSSFLTRQSSEREKELDALRNGTLGGGPATSGEFEQLGAAPRPNNRPANQPWNPPRPAPTVRPLAPSKYVTAGTTAGQTAYNGGEGDEVKTRSGPNTSRLGWLENRLNNPLQSPAFQDSHGLKFPREGMVARQQHVMETAEKADPLMRELDATNVLSHHVDKNARVGNQGYLFNGDQIVNTPAHGRVVADGAANPYYAVGAREFTNVQKLLPTLNGPRGPVTQADENKSRPNIWSEADVDPVKVQNSGWNHGPWASLQNRGADRLLHTSAASQQETPNGRGGTASQPIDYRYQVTNDHYKSAVPVAPVQENYAGSHPYSPPLMPANSPQMPAAGLPPRYKTNSLGVQLFQNETDEIKDAGDAAMKSSYNRRADENERVKVAGAIEDFETKRAYDGAAQAAQSAGAQRGSAEEARTQDDLKAFAPSESVQAMYGGMSARTAQSVAARQMEMQYEAARAWTDGDHAGDAPPRLRRPLSAAAEDMYG